MANQYPYTPAPGTTDTSAEAAMMMEPVTAHIQRLVLAAIRSAGSTGLTAHELAETLGMERTTVQPRTSELRKQELITDSGDRRPNPNGKNAIVWVASEARNSLRSDASFTGSAV